MENWYENDKNYIKDYERGMRLSDKVKYILDMSGMTQMELDKVLGYKSNEVHYMKEGWIPSYNVRQAINKLYRLWYELVEGESDE